MRRTGLPSLLASAIMSFYVGVSVEPSREAIAAAFAKHAPDARLRWGDIDEDCDNTMIYLELDTTASEFPFLLRTMNLTAYDCYRLGLEIAGELSVALRCRTVCDGTWHGTFSSPYWCLVWIEGQAHLGVDAGSAFADGAGEMSAEERAQLLPIQILDPLTPEQLAQPEREPQTQPQALDWPQPRPMYCPPPPFFGLVPK